MKFAVLLLALAIALTFASDKAVTAPQAATNLQSPIGNLKSADAITIPQMLSYQGKLTDTLGVPVQDTTYSVTFRLYTVPSGGAPFWSETQTVRTRSGLFSTLLGSVTPIGSVPDAGALYLGMAVDGGGELAPRLRIASAAYAYLSGRAANADLLQGKDTTGFVRTGQAASVTSDMVVDGTIAAADFSSMGAAAGQVMKWTGSAWAPRNDSVGSGGGADSAWVRQGSDSVLYTIHNLGIVRGDAGNVLYGGGAYSCVNFGIQCTTGTSGHNWIGSTVGGGYGNAARGGDATVAGGFGNSSGDYAAVGGGFENTASGNSATVAGGAENAASSPGATIGGGISNTVQAYYGGVLSGRSNVAGDAPDDTGAAVVAGGYNRAIGMWSFVGGGYHNSASGYDATVGGGMYDTASNNYATVGGGYDNVASGYDAVVSGGWENRASTVDAVVGGGNVNLASGTASTVPGGNYDTATASYAFAVGNHSVATYSNSAAFNGQATTASDQTRVGILSKASGSFTIDHPLDPQGKILNHYFIEGSQMRNIYDGEAVLDASGRAVINLPDYFDALNRVPRVQLTGVGTNGVVYVAEDVSGNRFTIGGPAGAKVYWQVTGERKDVSAEVTRRMMPVEQPKTGALAGRMLDDDFLVGCMEQLVREGKAQGIDFRTAAGRQRYERMKHQLEHPEH